jgi:hypothetical protein
MPEVGGQCPDVPAVFQEGVGVEVPQAMHPVTLAVPELDRIHTAFPSGGPIHEVTSLDRVPVLRVEVQLDRHQFPAWFLPRQRHLDRWICLGVLIERFGDEARQWRLPVGVVFRRGEDELASDDLDLSADLKHSLIVEPVLWREPEDLTLSQPAATADRHHRPVTRVQRSLDSLHLVGIPRQDHVPRGRGPLDRLRLARVVTPHTVVNGRENVSGSRQSMMPAFGEVPDVMLYIDHIYAYLKARADGELGRGRPQRLPPEEDPVFKEYQEQQG